MKAIKKLKEYATSILGGLATLIEYCLAIMLAVATVALCIYLVQAFLHIEGLEGWSVFYKDALETCLTLIIGVELLQMMYDHSPKMIFEVLLFCIARQIVVNDDDMISAVIGVVAIAVLFITKKYFFDTEEKIETAEEELTDIDKLKDENPQEFEKLNKYARYVISAKEAEAEKTDPELAEKLEELETFEKEQDMDSST